jgi:hypothetical protein
LGNRAIFREIESAITEGMPLGIAVVGLECPHIHRQYDQLVTDGAVLKWHPAMMRARSMHSMCSAPERGGEGMRESDEALFASRSR